VASRAEREASPRSARHPTVRHSPPARAEGSEAAEGVSAARPLAGCAKSHSSPVKSHVITRWGLACSNNTSPS
jgi:hypothetical protein